MDDGRTISQPPCDTHPPLRDWPAKNLINDTCPTCGQCQVFPEATVRELRLRRVVEGMFQQDR